MTDTLLRAHDLITVVSEPQPTLEIPVEVWCAYSQRWVQGFRLHDTLSDGKLVLLGRDSEAVLPAAFDPESVRFAVAERSASLLAWKQSAA